MDAFGSLELSWAHGYNGSELHFIDNQTLFYSCGNILVFVDKKGKHIKSIPSEGKGIGTIAVCQDLGLLAYSEDSLEPLIYIIKYPECSIMHSLKGDAKLKYNCLAFSGDGHKLASLSGVPDFLFTIWNLDDGMSICQKSVVFNREMSNSVAATGQVCFNPLNWKQLCVLGQDRVTLWTVECCDTDNILTSVSVALPEVHTPVGVAVDSETHKGKAAQAQDSNNSTQTKVEGLVPDMKTVYYKQLYEEATRKISPVVPTSFCWTPHSTLYIGCEGGQLLLTDVESGTTKVLANPAVSLQQDKDAFTATEASSNEKDTIPNTAHAVLHEGSLQSLALSQKGLFVGGKDGLIYLFDQSSELRALDSCKLPYPVKTMLWSMDYTSLGVGTDQGCIYNLNPGNLSHLSITQEHSSSSFVGLDTIGIATDSVLTCRQDGTLQAWDILSGSLLSTLSLSTTCMDLTCPNSSSSAVVGCEDGCVYMINVVDLKSMKPVKRERFYQTPVRAVRSDVYGRFVVVVSTTGSVFLCSAYPGNAIEILGHTVIDGEILDVSLLPVAWDVASTTKLGVLHTNHEGTCSVEMFSIPNGLAESEFEGIYRNPTKLFDDDAIHRQCIVVSEQILSFVLAPNNGCFLIPKRSKAMYKANLPSPEDKICEVSLNDLAPITNHDLVGGSYRLSFHQRWLVSCGRDGKLLLRLVESPNRTLHCTPHHYKTGGGKYFTLTPDGQSVVTVGDNQTLTCWKWELSNHGKSKMSGVDHYLTTKAKQFSAIAETQNTIMQNMPVIGSDQVSEKTWLERAAEEAHRTEDEKYAEKKAELRNEIAKLREKVMLMIASNEQVPDIEHLDRSEFILDTEEHLRHKEAEEKRIAVVREEIELNNLAKMYLRDVIKRQCWDKMKVKGKVVKAFLSRLEVSNYPLREVTVADKNELERVKARRKVELTEKETRKEVLTNHLKQHPRHSIVADESGLDEEEDRRDGGGETSEPYALFGSRGEEYGGKSEFLYDQFELMSTVSKEHQIVLLQECIRNIKETFNKEFDELLRVKETEIGRIQEKNMRIKKIAHDLKVEEKLFIPSLDPEEQPERILQVNDEEVVVEKFITEEERQRMEEKAKEDEERRLKEMADNWRDRGLDLMMGGRLEANAEEDLFKDMARPEFMSKDPTELTEEEIRMKHDFEKKETKFLEERAKLIKSLEAEMKKNQESIQQILESFDEKLTKLFHLKIHTEMAIQEEELKIVRLTTSLYVEDEVKMKEEELEIKLNNTKQAKISSANTFAQTKKMVDEAQVEYDNIVLEDKEFDRSFKRDFADCDPYVDQLYRLFRKRPRGHRLRGGEATLGTINSTTKTDNPFGIRPSSASLTHKPSVVSVPGGGDKPELIMAELDDPENMPDGLEPPQWDRFVAVRHRKVESELKVKSKALRLAEMKEFLRKREEELDQYQYEIQETYKNLSNLHEDKSMFDMNPEIQFLLRQGQVEINTGGGFVPDFSDSVLIHRSEIEEINTQIRALGEAKLSSMNECKDFKRGICMLEWELKRLHMEAEDLVAKAKDVQMLRVTKELQERLMMDNIQRKDQNQIETLEKTLELNKKTHRRRMNRQKRKLETLINEVKDRTQQNMEIETGLEEKVVEVAERQQIQDLAGPLPSEVNAEIRMREIVGRSRLVELAKAQAKEVGVLRKEVERLRMRTFPALVQVDNF